MSGLADRLEQMKAYYNMGGADRASIDEAIAALTARDEGIEAAAKLAHAQGNLQGRWLAEDIRKLKGQP